MEIRKAELVEKARLREKGKLRQAPWWLPWAAFSVRLLRRSLVWVAQARLEQGRW